jgi:hypothetical protein
MIYHVMHILSGDILGWILRQVIGTPRFTRQLQGSQLLPFTIV